MSNVEEDEVYPNTQAVAAALARAGAAGQVHELEASTRTAAAAAAALGCPVGAIANSPVFLADDQPVLVLTSGAHRVDTAHLAAQLAARAVRRASPEQVPAASGQPAGGCDAAGGAHLNRRRALGLPGCVGGCQHPAHGLPHHQLLVAGGG